MPPRKKKVAPPPVVVKQVVEEKPKRQIENKPHHVNFYSYCQSLIRIEKLDATLHIHADVIKQVLKLIKTVDDTKHPVVFQLKLLKDQPPVVNDPFEILELETDPELQLMVDKINQKNKPSLEVEEV